MRLLIWIAVLVLSACGRIEQLTPQPGGLPAPSTLKAPRADNPPDPDDRSFWSYGGAWMEASNINQFGIATVPASGMAWGVWYVPAEHIGPQLYTMCLWQTSQQDEPQAPEQCWLAIANKELDTWEIIPTDAQGDGQDALFLQSLPQSYLDAEGEHAWLAVLITEPGTYELFNIGIGPDPLPDPWNDQR